MNAHNPAEPPQPPAIALLLAYYELYEEVKTARHMLGEHRSRKAIAVQLEAIRARADQMYESGSLLETALTELSKITRELRQAYDKLTDDSSHAYYDGMADALNDLTAHAPPNDRDILRWLLNCLIAGILDPDDHWDDAMNALRASRHRPLPPADTA